MEEHNWKLARKYQQVEKEVRMWEGFQLEDARMVVVAFGTAARIAKGAVKRARKEGVRVGLFRPITLWPFPYDELKGFYQKGAESFVVFELNAGQMIEDVKLALGPDASIFSYARPGGAVPSPQEVARVFSRLSLTRR